MRKTMKLNPMSAPTLMLSMVVCSGVTAAEQGKAPYVLDRDGSVPQPVVAVADVAAWPNLTQLPDGTIIALIYNQPSHGQMPGDVDCWATEDAGVTWTKRSTAAPRGTPQQNRMNTAAGLTADGKLILVTSGWSEPGNPDAKGKPNIGELLPTWVCISDDGGYTWRIDEQSFPNGPDGRPMIPFGDIMPGEDGMLRVAAYSTPDEEPAQQAAKQAGDNLAQRAAHGQNWIVRGDGRNWDAPVRIAHRPRRNETAILHLGGGKWIAAARKAGLELFFSEDDAKTWTMLGERVTDNLQHPGHLMRLKDRSIMLSYGNRVRPHPGVEVKFSKDEGRTWSAPYRIADVNSPDSGYPSSVQLSDGRILTACYSRGIAGHDGYVMFTVTWDPARTQNR
jgi:hypothetical protein